MSEFLPLVFKRAREVEVRGTLCPAGWYVEVNCNGVTRNYGPFSKRVKAVELAEKPFERWGNQFLELKGRR